MSRTVSEYTVRKLTFDSKLVKDVMARRKKGESLAKIAKALKVGQGKVAMAELVGTTKRVDAADSAAMAKAIVSDRRTGASWGLLAARYRVTEGTARAEYEAATGEPANSLDFRRKAA